MEGHIMYLSLCPEPCPAVFFAFVERSALPGGEDQLKQLIDDQPAQRTFLGWLKGWFGL
jgi:hypothetical protein